MSSYYTITLTNEDKKHIPEILRLAAKYNGDELFFDTKDGTGYEFEFNNDSDRVAFKNATDKLGLFKSGA